MRPMQTHYRVSAGDTLPGAGAADRDPPCGAAAASACVPFELGPRGQIFVCVTVNGALASAVLDSGATSSVLDAGFARRLDVTVQHGRTVGGLTGSIPTVGASAVRVHFGGHSVNLPRADLLDLTAMGEIARRRIDLVLGQEFFNRAVLTIDFDRRELEVFDAVNWRPRPEARPVLLSANRQGLYIANVNLDRVGAVEAVIDLGSDVPIYVSPTFVQDTGLFADRTVSTAATAGVEGVDIGHIALLHRVGLGLHETTGVPAVAPKAWNCASPVVIGLPLLRRYNLAFDVAHGRLWISPSSDGCAQPMARDRSGIHGVADIAAGRLRIVHVAEGSPAQTAGLAAGDEIVAIDDVALDQAYFQSGARAGFQPAGVVLSLRLADGRETALKLCDYI